MPMTIHAPRIRRGISAFAAALLLGSASTAIAKGEWISQADHAGAEAGKESVSLQFRRDISLSTLPSHLMVKVSGDNRFVLYVNGERVAAGPARGDLPHWRFHRVDLAPYLKTGNNVIAAQVWNDGAAAGVSQVWARTGFWLEAEDSAYSSLDSGDGWQVRIDGARTVNPAQPGLFRQLGGKYFASPPPETIDAAKLAPDWNTAGSTLTDWEAPVPTLATGEEQPWTLIENKLPPMRMEPMDGGKQVRAWGIRANRFPEKSLKIPANSDVLLRLDMGAMRAAYPTLVTSGGEGATIDLTYAEAPYGEDLNYLADRGDAKSGWILGLTDHFLPSGGEDESFSPYWWRAWRYAEIRVKTGDDPLTLESFTRTGTGYPFETVATFKSDDPELEKIWQIGWDTVQVDGHETYMDTAYWEQLQYVGDTRIQALVSYAVSGDPRLAEQAVEAFAASERDGIIQSRYPANLFQSIPPFALLWVGMLHDYWMRQPDPLPVMGALDEMRSSLDWYGNYVEEDGLVGTTSGWEFIDWRDDLSNYPETTDPSKTERCITSLMYYGALRQAADIEGAIGDAARGADFAGRAEPLGDAIRNMCWDAQRGIFADQPAKTSYSQHANILAVLYDVAPKDQQQAILRRVLADGDWPNAPEGIIPATYYFDFYLARALNHANMGDEYLKILAPWRRMLAQHFTTWPESPDPSRSDSHAWSAHPTFDLLTIVAGIDTAAPAFAKVRIEPHLGPLKQVKASYAHPAGTIAVSYAKRDDGGLDANILLPRGIDGEFVWGGTTHALNAGENYLELE